MNARIRDDVTNEQLAAGREKARQKKAFTMYFDMLDTIDKLSNDSQFRTIVMGIADYAKTGEHKTFDDPIVTLAVEMSANAVDRDIEKYAISCANKQAGIAAKKEREKPPNEGIFLT